MSEHYRFETLQVHAGQESAPGTNACAVPIYQTWLLHKPGVTSPIIGASKIEHLKEAVEAVDSVLSEEEIKLLEELYQPHSILGHK